MDVINSQIAVFFALNRTISPAIEKGTLKKTPIRFQGLFKVTNQTAGK